jgi:transposase
MDVKLMHRQGASIREIARRTGLSRVTVRRILSRPVPKAYGPRKPKPGKLEPFLGYLETTLAQRPDVRATVLYEAIAAQGYAGHYEGVKRWVRGRRREETARRRACVRFESLPGVEGQIDWKGPARGLLRDDLSAVVHFFRFVLAWSRMRWTLVVRSLELGQTLAALRWAIEQAGGVPHRLVVDNAKTLVIRPKPHLVLHPSFADFCRHYGIEPAPAWPYSPQRKGKIERSFQDLERAGVLDRTYESVDELQAVVTACDLQHAQRVHGTVGERPGARFERERGALIDLPALVFDPRVPETRKVLSDCCVSYGAAFYSVPHQLVGSKVVVKADPLGDGLEIFAADQLVARHQRVPKGRTSLVEEHVAELRRPRVDRLPKRLTPAVTLPPPAGLVARSVVPWPRTLDVAQRPIEEYLAATGGVL